jgi:[ribosomal protein S5]-alanine N-acetyltransferase
MLSPVFTPFPVLLTSRLVLRQLRETDAEEMLFLRSDAQVQRFVNRPLLSTLNEAAEYILHINTLIGKNEVVLWGITLKPDDKIVGYACIWKLETENYRAELGYVLHPAHHRRGIMKEALESVIEYAFKQVGLHTITADVNPVNVASIELLKHLGFEQEAYFKENCYFEGKFLDSVIFTKRHSLEGVS